PRTTPLYLASVLLTYPAPPTPSTPPLHDALPISSTRSPARRPRPQAAPRHRSRPCRATARRAARPGDAGASRPRSPPLRCLGARSEEHTSELQSLTNLVFRLLLGIQNIRLHHTTP